MELIFFSAALILADLVTTVFAVRRWGPGIEYNPLWRLIMRRRGLISFAVAYCVFWTALLFAADYAQMVWVILAGLIIDTAMSARSLYANRHDRGYYP